MKLADLKKHVDSLRGASRFRYGDPTTFSVPLLPLEVELPGPSDPDAYLSKLQAKFKLKFSDTRCLVVGAGNGGLCAALMNLGAKEVVAAEDRDRFHAALDEVIHLVAGLHEFNPLTYRSWPSTGCERSLGEFDLILFPESLEECRVPCETLETVCRLLKADGQLVVEVHHGEQSVLKDPVNAFKPTKDAFAQMMKDITGNEPLAQIPGRAQNRTIYLVSRTHQLGRAKAAPKAPLPTMPREKKAAPAAPPKVEEKPAPKKPAPKPKPSDPEKDPRLGHMLNGPPMSDETVARHKEYFEGGKDEKPAKTTKKKSKRSGRNKKTSSDES